MGTTAALVLALCAWVEQPSDVSPEALKIHQSALLIDGHNDLPWQIRSRGKFRFEQYDISKRLPFGHTDIPRLRRGGVKAQFWSVYVPVSLATERRAVTATLEQIDIVYRMVERYPESFEIARTAEDVQRIVKSGKIASLIGIEGGHSIDNSLGALRMFHRLGVRYMTLTHSSNLLWADSSTDDSVHSGLTPFGEAVVREMNRLGMLVDISHVSAATMRDTLRISKAPVIASHSSAYSLASHPRNVPDDVLRLVKRNGGVIMVNFFSGFIHPEAAQLLNERREMRVSLRKEYSDDVEFRSAWAEWNKGRSLPRGTLALVIEHIDHIAKIAGPECVGIGADYDGIDVTPVGLEDVTSYPKITEKLLQKGYSSDQIKGILGGNVLRVMGQVEQAAARASSSPPIVETLDLD